MLQNNTIALLRSIKPFERRLPVHPEHFKLINQEFRNYIYIEEDYSIDFNYSDLYYRDLGYNIGNRETLLNFSECCLLVKPTPQDLLQMKRGATSLGWFHCVQNQNITDAAIKNNLTLICMESLFNEDGQYFFQENSKITGKHGVIHALESANIKMHKDMVAVVIGHGNAGVSAIHQLLDLGISNIICCSKRNKNNIHDKINGIVYEQIKFCDNKIVTSDNLPIINILKKADIIINATAQDIYKPLIFLQQNDLLKLKSNSLIIDLSCDKNMGFEFATITSFNKPIIKLENSLYYAIDHIPTIDYNNATMAISEQIVSIIPLIFEYLNANIIPPIIERAIQIKNGNIINPDINYYNQYFSSSLGKYTDLKM
jgi:alanine dehydrogenase